MTEIPVYIDNVQVTTGTIDSSGSLVVVLPTGSRLVADLTGATIDDVSITEGFEYRRVRPDGRPVLGATFDSPPTVDDGYTVDARLSGPWRPYLPGAQILPTDHVVEFRDGGFTIQHPLHERLGGALWDCRVHQYMSEHQPPPDLVGLYVFTWAPDGSPVLTPKE